MSTSYMVSVNIKLLGTGNSIEDVERLIKNRFNHRRDDIYEVKNLDNDSLICISDFIAELKDAAKPKKEFKFPEPKPYIKPKQKTYVKPKPYTKPKQKKYEDIKWPKRRPYSTPDPKSHVKGELKTHVKPKKNPKQTKYEDIKWPEPKPHKPRRIGKNDIIDDDYCRWLGTQPCIITGREAERGIGPQNIHCHHISGRRPKNDYLQVPLLGLVHSWGPLSYHDLGKTRFLKKWQEQGVLLEVYDVIKYFEEHAARLKKEYDTMMEKKSPAIRQ